MILTTTWYWIQLAEFVWWTLNYFLNFVHRYKSEILNAVNGKVNIRSQHYVIAVSLRFVISFLLVSILLIKSLKSWARSADILPTDRTHSFGHSNKYCATLNRLLDHGDTMLFSLCSSLIGQTECHDQVLFCAISVPICVEYFWHYGDLYCTRSM